MTIEEAHKILSNGLANAPSEHEWCMAFKMAIDTLCAYQQLKADYESHLKVDMVVILNKIRTEIEQAADKQFQIAMGITDLNERYTHIQVENAYRHSLNIIDKYKDEFERKYGAEEIEHKCHNCAHYLKGEYDGNCGSYICKDYSAWEQKR